VGEAAVIQEFAETKFKDLISTENNYVLRRFLEAQVQVET